MSMNTLEDRIHHARSTSNGILLPRYQSFHDLFLDHYTKQSREKTFLHYYVGQEKTAIFTYHEFIDIIRKNV